MALYVNTNVAALNGQKNLTNVTNRMNSSFEKLSSGSRINSAKDDAAGLQISDRLTTQIIGLEQGTRNANDGISIAQIAEGALSEVTNNVQRMRQLVVQGGNRTLSSDDRESLSQEFAKLLDVNNNIAERTAFGTRPLLNYTSPHAGFLIQSGDKSGEQDTVTTGNAKLTSLFGDILADEGVAGNLTVMSAFAASDLDQTGTLGKLVVANMIATDESAVSVAFADLFGGTVPTGALSNLPTNSAIQMDHATLTGLLTADISAMAGASTVTDADLTILVAMSAAGQGLLGVTSAQLSSDVGFSDEQLNTVNGYLTDVLLDMMSDLVTQVDKDRAKLGAEQNGLSSTIRSNTTAVVNVSDSRSRITDTDFARETAELTRNQIIQQASNSILAQANQLPQAALSLLGG